MTRLMFDSTSPWDIPRDAEMVAYYVDGRYKWPQSWIDMFPNAVKVLISAIGVSTAKVGDVEVGCIWPPGNAVPWVLRARADGYDPTIYVNELNDWWAVREAFRIAGVPEPHYWTARYNGVREIPAGAVARQFAHPHDGDGVADRPWETGKHYDLSIVADYWPGVDSSGPGGGGGAGDEMNEQQETWLRQLYELFFPGGDTVRAILATGEIPDGSGWKKDGLAFRLLDLYRAVATVAGETGMTLGDAVEHLISLASSLTDDETRLLAAIRSQPTGAQVDEGTLTAALTALGVSREGIESAVRAVLRSGTEGKLT